MRWRRLPPLANLASDCRIIHGVGAFLRVRLVAGLLLLLGSVATAQEIRAPKISIPAVDWDDRARGAE